MPLARPVLARVAASARPSLTGLARDRLALRVRMLLRRVDHAVAQDVRLVRDRSHVRRRHLGRGQSRGRQHKADEDGDGNDEPSAHNAPPARRPAPVAPASPSADANAVRKPHQAQAGRAARRCPDLA